jgi:hypothetical protein
VNLALGKLFWQWQQRRWPPQTNATAMNKISVKLIDLNLSIFEDDNQVGRMIVQIKQAQ